MPCKSGTQSSGSLSRDLERRLRSVIAQTVAAVRGSLSREVGSSWRAVPLCRFRQRLLPSAGADITHTGVSGSLGRRHSSCDDAWSGWNDRKEGRMDGMEQRGLRSQLTRLLASPVPLPLCDGACVSAQTSFSFSLFLSRRGFGCCCGCCTRVRVSREKASHAA